MRFWKGALITLAVLLGLELLLRGVARATDKVRGVCFDPVLGWRMIPGVTRTGPMWGGTLPTTLNSSGWRDEEFGPRNPGRTRLVALGDSFTFGFGVDFGARYTEQLEALCPGLEVCNLGMNAIGPDQEELILEHHGLALEPDLVLCQVYEDNDFTDVACTTNGYWPKPWFRLTAGELEFVPPPHPWHVGLRESSYLGEALFRALQARMAYKELAPEWEGADTSELIARLLVRMRALATKRGSHLLVLLVTTGKRAREMARLRSALERDGVETLEARAWFDTPEERARYLLSDGHWNAEGHRLAAEGLARELRNRGWLP